MGHRALAEIMALNMVVEVGLVTGVTPATMPTGSAICTMPESSSSSITPTVFWSLISCQMYSVANRFLMILSSYTPRPVSSTAILASWVWLSRPASAMAWAISSTCSWVRAIYSSMAILARAARASIISWTFTCGAAGVSFGADIVMTSFKFVKNVLACLVHLY